MTGYEVWQNYISVKTHFTNETYDATKYRKPSGKVSTYNKRNDKSFFEYISKRFQDNEIKPFFISQFVETDTYIIDLVDDLDDCVKTFHSWKKRMSQLFYVVEKDCRNVKNFMDEKEIQFNDMFKANENKYPIIMRLMMEKFISLETYIILEKVFTLSKEYDKVYGSNDYIYDDYSLKIRKYSYYFRTVDTSKYKSLLREIFKV